MISLQYFLNSSANNPVFITKETDIPEDFLNKVYFGNAFDKWKKKAIRSTERALKARVLKKMKDNFPQAWQNKSGWKDKMFEGLRSGKRLHETTSGEVAGKVHVMGVRTLGKTKAMARNQKSGTFRLRFFEGGTRRGITPKLWLTNEAKHFPAVGYIKAYLNSYLVKKGVV